jgi:hypothetical protein
MPATAAEIVSQSRGFHYTFDPHNVPEPEAVSHLSRLQIRLAQRVTAMSEDALAVPMTFAKPLVDDAAVAGIMGEGLALPDHIQILTVTTSHVGGDRILPVEMLTYANRHEARYRWPAVVVMRGKLYPVNRSEIAGYMLKGDVPAESGWELLDGLGVVLVPLPPQLTGPDSMITLPDLTHDALVTNLALFMAQRLNLNWPTLHDQAMKAEEVAVYALADQDSTSTWTVV